MFNPLAGDFSELTDHQVDEKISDLSRKYWQTRNAQVRTQIATILEMYKVEAHSRRVKAYQQQAENGDNDLDSLINVN